MSWLQVKDALKTPVGQTVTVKGWVRTRRDSKAGLSFVAVSDGTCFDALQIVGTLLLTQLLPLGVGLAVRYWRPTLADRLQKPANLASKILNLAAVGCILATQYELLLAIRPSGFAWMLLLLLLSWAAGFLLGGPAMDRRKALALTTGLRNVGAGGRRPLLSRRGTYNEHRAQSYNDSEDFHRHSPVIAGLDPA